MPATPQFAFRAAPETVAAIVELQALLAARRGGGRVSKAAAIDYAVRRAVADLQAGGDVVDRMTLAELGAAYRAKLDAENQATAAALDAQGLEWERRPVTSPATGMTETRVQATGREAAQYVRVTVLAPSAEVP